VCAVPKDSGALGYSVEGTYRSSLGQKYRPLDTTFSTHSAPEADARLQIIYPVILMLDIWSILLGLIFAWIILMVVDRVKSTYEPAPVAPAAPTYVCKPVDSSDQDAMMAVGLASRMDLPADSIVKSPEINMPRPNLDEAPMPGAPAPDAPMGVPDSSPLMTSQSVSTPPVAPMAPAPAVPPASQPDGAVLQQAPAPAAGP